MKTACCFILTLFIFFAFAFLPNGFAQAHRPMVRLIYFLPNDRQPRQDMDTKMDALIKDVQRIFADEMERHGFGRKTFHIETDRTGKAVVHRVNGQFADAYYQENYWESVRDKISESFDLSKNFYVISIETRTGSLCGLGAADGSGAGMIMIPSSGLCFESTGATTHELGHAFRLDHDFRNNLYHMSYGEDWEKNQFSPCAAKWFDAHRAFNAAHAAVDEPATVKMLSQSVVPSSNAMRLRFQVTDPNGLHQVQLKSDTTDEDPAPGTKLIDCKSLSGESRTVEFVTTRLTPKNKRVYLAVMDVHGNFEQYEFPIDVPVQEQPATTEVRVDASVDVLIYTGHVSWITRPAAITEAQTTKRLLQSAGLQAEITDNENTVKQWMLQTASDGSVDVLLLYGPIPATIYPPKNAMPEGSVAENWIETPDGNTILNHADYFGFRSTDQRHRNGAAMLQNLMDIPGIFIPTDRFNIPMFVTPQGSAVTPSLVDFQSDRPFPLNQLQGKWFAEKIFASNTGTAEATLADPVIVRDGDRGRIAIVHQTSFEDNPKGEVAAEIIINYLLLETPAPAQPVTIPDANLRAKIEEVLGKASGATITTADMETLTSLDAYSANISNLTGLEYATNLTALQLQDNSVSNLSPLEGLTNLDSLVLSDNSVSDISALRGLTNLTELYLGFNSISDLSPLSDLTNLTELLLWDNNISDLSTLTGLTNLTALYLQGNTISDLLPLVANTGLGSGDEVDVTGNPLNVVSINTHIPALERRGVMVEFDPPEPASPEFLLSVPAGTSLIHVPLKVTAVDEVEMQINSVGDLYDALGGADIVNFLITYDSQAQEWFSYFGPSDKGGPADSGLGDDTGIIVGLRALASVHLRGTALGTDGNSSINLSPGLNVVGLPLNDSRITRVSDLLTLEGISGNVPVIILTDGGEFKAVGRAGDPGDIEITGGQSYILNAGQAATVTISGEAWTNVSGTAAAPSLAITGREAENVTPVLALRGSIFTEEGGFDKAGFQVTVKNLSTDKAITGMTQDEGIGYRLTVVDIETGRAATIGDILDISAQSPNPFIGVKPLRYTVTAEDVKRSWIQLPHLVLYEIPAETELLANYPNPFNPETWIPYRLAEDAFVTLTIYNNSGQVVRTLNVGHRIAAVYENRSKAVYWDGRNEVGEQVASGVYFYHLSAGDYSATRRMVIVK